MKKHFNLYYIFREDWMNNPMQKEARERILKIVNLLFAKDRCAALPSSKEEQD